MYMAKYIRTQHTARGSGLVGTGRLDTVSGITKVVHGTVQCSAFGEITRNGAGYAMQSMAEVSS